MNTDLESLLREGMERFAPDLRVPAELAATVVRRYRRRRRAAMAAAACAVVAVAVFAAARLAPGGPATAGRAGGMTRARTVAYVMRSAAHAAGRQQLIEYARSVNVLYPATYDELSWTYFNTGSCTGRRLRESFLDGKAVAQYATTWRSRGLTRTAVEYPGRDWARWSLHLSRAARCSSAAATGQPAATRLVDYRQFLEWGLAHKSLLRIAGTVTVDGVRAIEIVSAPGPLPSGERPTWKFWVNPQTYLPVRTLFDNQRMLPRVDSADIQTDYKWLPPTGPNLAKLTAQIPAGFQRKAAGQLSYDDVCGFIPCN